MASGDQVSHFNKYFVSGDGIDEEVIKAHICYYLGDDAVVYPERTRHPKSGYVEDGFAYEAYRSFMKHEIEELKSNSMQWQVERQEKEQKDHQSNEAILLPAPSKSTWVAPPDYSLPPGSNYNSPMQPQYGSVIQSNALMRSQSEPVMTGANENIRDVKLIHPENATMRNSVAFLDTGCQTGNWVSRRMVDVLGADYLIDYSAPVKELQAGNMGIVQSRGAITLDWRWLPKGIKVNTAIFNVADATHYDLIIGNEYITQNGLIKYIEEAFSPFVEDDPVVSPNEKEEIKKAKEKQKQEKSDREAAKQKTASSHRSRDKEHRKKR